MYKGINTTLDEGQTPIVTIGGGFDVAQPIPYDLYQITAPVNRQNRKPGDPCHTLARDNAAHAAVAIQGTLIGRSENAGPQGSGADVSGAMFTLTKTDVHAVAFPWQSALDPIGNPTDISGTLVKNQTMAVAFGGDIARSLTARHDSSPCADRGMDVVAQLPAMQVRRLTPVECERLQGFPDGYTNIPWRGKPESPDGPRYKALGNSMAVLVMRWIGERINKVEAL
jgi:DNA (cytosine-5)-methyltransferase 1